MTSQWDVSPVMIAHGVVAQSNQHRVCATFFAGKSSVLQCHDPVTGHCTLNRTLERETFVATYDPWLLVHNSSKHELYAIDPFVEQGRIAWTIPVDAFTSVVVSYDRSFLLLQSGSSISKYSRITG